MFNFSKNGKDYAGFDELGLQALVDKGVLTPQEVSTIVDFSSSETNAIIQLDSIQALKDLKITEIANAYEQAMQDLVSDYPLKERETWRKQEEQARAFVADNQALTPGLDALAAASGRDKDELANTIIAKSDALLVASLSLTGKKQALIAQIDKADESALETIAW